MVTARMSPWIPLLRFLHDHIVLILVGGVVVLILAFWFVLEGFRNTASKDEVFRLRQRLYQLERERNFSGVSSAPPVLSARWVKVGSAATTSDGGCLLLVERTSPLQKRVTMTVRVDGVPARKSVPMVVGQRMQLDGKSGLYSIELFATEKDRARFTVTLTSHHLTALQGDA